MKSNSPNTQQSASLKREANKTESFREFLIATQPDVAKPISTWRFVVPLMIQIWLILMAPLPAIYTQLTGKTAFLQSVAADPYDLLRGYSINLNYNISRINTLQRLPGWEELIRQYRGLPEGTNLYVILQGQQSTNQVIPKAWKPVRVSGDRPSSLGDNQVALKGRYQNGSIIYGLESYNIPEEERQQINKDLFRAQEINQGKPQPVVMEVKVDRQGKAVPVSMWMGDPSGNGRNPRNYRF